MPTLCFESFFASSTVLWIDGDTSLSSSFCSIQQMAFMTLHDASFVHLLHSAAKTIRNG